MHPRAQRPQRRQDVGVRVPVPVVGADADQRHLGVHRHQERRIGRPRTVVGHGQHVGRQPVGPVDQQVGLGLALDVTREQHPGPAVGDPQHEGGLVALAAREAVRAAGWRMQDLDREVTEVDGGPLDRCADGHAARRRLRQQPGGRGQPGGQRPGPHRPDAHPPQDLGDTADVIEMGMGDHHQIEMTTAMPTQPARCGPVLTGVDQHAGPRRLHEERIALADVDRRHPQPLWGQAPGHRREHRQREGCHQDARGQPTWSVTVPGQQPHGPRSRGDERERPAHVDRATATGQRLGDGQDDRGTRPGQREAAGRETDVDDRQSRRDEGDRRRHDRRRHRHQVGREADEVEFAEGGQQHREHGELGSDRHPDQRRDPPRHARRQAIPDHRGQQQHAGGGGRGEHQADRAGQAGIEQDQQQHGHRQGVPGIADVAPGPRQEQHQDHGPRP